MLKKPIIQGQNFRWVVPQISPEIWSKKDQFKADLLDRLRLSKTAKKGIKFYSIAIESHADGNPHFDISPSLNCCKMIVFETILKKIKSEWVLIYLLH